MPRPSRSRSPLHPWLLTALALGLAAHSVVGRGATPAAPEPAPSQPPVTASADEALPPAVEPTAPAIDEAGPREVQPPTPEPTDAELAERWQSYAYDAQEELAAKVEDLERQVARLETELRRERGASRDCQAGLTRARSLLAGGGAGGGGRGSGARSAEASSARQSGPRVTAPTPRVQILGNSILVTGTLHNRGGEDAWVSLTLDLMVDQRRWDQAVLSVAVPAGTSTPFAHTYRHPHLKGTYSARAWLDY